MPIIENVSVCKLGGNIGSDPEVVGSFPDLALSIQDSEQREFIGCSLPDGALPGSFTEEVLNDKKILSYVFRIKSQDAVVRDDLASISLIVGDKERGHGGTQVVIQGHRRHVQGQDRNAHARDVHDTDGAHL